MRAAVGFLHPGAGPEGGPGPGQVPDEDRPGPRSEIQRLQKTLETAGIKLSSVVSDVTGVSATAMVEALIDGERRGAVLADLAIGRMRTRQKMAGLSMALAGRFTAHHA